MNPLVLIVEDNNDLLFNLDLMLRANNYRTILARNGKEAIERMEVSKNIPDIIISDILMPKMNGYEFFKIVANDRRYNRIPFVFLSARASQKDIRLGKILGADDYITKPFVERDLLAVIKGKTLRAERIEAVDEELEKVEFEKDQIKNLRDDQDYLLHVVWDDKLGPELKDYYPKEFIFHIPLESIANQLFSAITTIYGQEKINRAEGLLINVKNINLYGYLYFDAYPSESERFKEKQYMLAYLSPYISYLHSLEIRAIFELISKKIKKKEGWDIIKKWNLIRKGLER